MPVVTRPGIRKFPLRDEEKKPKPRLGPTVPSGLPAITVTMHETDTNNNHISRSVTVPSLDFAFLDEYAAADSDSSEKGTKGGCRDLERDWRGALWASTAKTFGRLRSFGVKDRMGRGGKLKKTFEPLSDYSFASDDCTTGRK